LGLRKAWGHPTSSWTEGGVLVNTNGQPKAGGRVSKVCRGDSDYQNDVSPAWGTEGHRHWCLAQGWSVAKDKEFTKRASANLRKLGQVWPENTMRVGKNWEKASKDKQHWKSLGDWMTKGVPCAGGGQEGEN